MIIDRIFVTAVIGALVLGCAAKPPVADSQPRPEGLTPEQAKALIPEAAGMSIADFEFLAKGQVPTPQSIASQSLSLVLLTIDPRAGVENPSALQDFQYTHEVPIPHKIAEAMVISRAKGYASFIQSEYITDCTCTTQGDSAKGTVSFEAKDLYKGKVEFTARKADSKWRIEEFRLPNYKIMTRLGPKAIWERTPKLPDPE